MHDTKSTTIHYWFQLVLFIIVHKDNVIYAIMKRVFKFYECLNGDKYV